MLRLLVLLMGLSCVRAQAQDARLSDRGRWLMAGSVAGSWSNTEGVNRQPQPLAWEIRAAPSVLYFVRDRIAIGGYAGYGYKRDPFLGYILSTHGVSAGVQAGFEIVLAPRLGWMLFPSVGYTWQHLTLDDKTSAFFTSTAAGARTQQRSTLRNARITGHFDILQFGLLAPLVFHVSDGLGFGLGPEVAVDVYLQERSRDDGRRFAQVRLGFGSWIGASF